MTKRIPRTTKKKKNEEVTNVEVAQNFQLNFLTASQKLAWQAFQNHDVLFLLGCAGVGKSYVAAAFAVAEILKKTKKKIYLSRPVVEAGESIGFLPGELKEKLHYYLLPLYTILDSLTTNPTQKTIIKSSVELAPIAFMRGTTIDDAVFILDEAQNCTRTQLKLALTRLGKNSKMIITGDPEQSDLTGNVALVDVIARLRNLDGVGIIEFKESSVVRHPLVAKILKCL